LGYAVSRLASYPGASTRPLAGGSQADLSPAQRSIRAVSSDALEDPTWDRFLSASGCGQYQQTSVWARVKATEGWNCARTVLWDEDRCLGGFQLLHRRTRFGSLGYVTKGPVLAAEEGDAAKACISALQEAMERLRLRALVAQPPDASGLEPLLLDAGFDHAPLLRVADANLLIDLDEHLEQRLPAATRKRVRQAARRGVTVREGRSEELHAFYALMAKTCERRGVAPNPSESVLHEIWRLFSAEADVRVSFAEVDGQPVAGLLSLGYGDRLTIWKKGWNGAAADARPNHGLYHETLLWARDAGYRVCDFGGLERGIAATLLRGEPLSPEQRAGRDFFNLTFGGRPVLLPRPLILFPSRLYRLAHRLMSRSRRLSSVGQHWLASP
jgi:lipid II:glycine glycyltransferase (peptidoglycan interpeptide bridge formation enzyme)